MPGLAVAVQIERIRSPNPRLRSDFCKFIARRSPQKVDGPNFHSNFQSGWPQLPERIVSVSVAPIRFCGGRGLLMK